MDFLTSVAGTGHTLYDALIILAVCLTVLVRGWQHSQAMDGHREDRSDQRTAILTAAPEQAKALEAMGPAKPPGTGIPLLLVLIGLAAILGARTHLLALNKQCTYDSDCPTGQQCSSGTCTARAAAGILWTGTQPGDEPDHRPNPFGERRREPILISSDDKRVRR